VAVGLLGASVADDVGDAVGESVGAVEVAVVGVATGCVTVEGVDPAAEDLAAAPHALTSANDLTATAANESRRWKSTSGERGGL
jgi:hypothetical protein